MVSKGFRSSYQLRGGRGVQMGIPVVGVPIAQGIQNQIVGGMQVGLSGAGGMQVDY